MLSYQSIPSVGLEGALADIVGQGFVFVIVLLVILIPSPALIVSCFPEIAEATSPAVWYPALLVNTDILAPGCTAVAHAAAPLSIVAKFEIVFCLLFKA